MVFALCIFGACNADSKGTAIGEITGVTEIYLKTGEGTDEKLLEGVDVVLPDGSKVKPNIVKNGYNAQAAGKYTITFTYGNAKKNVNVFVYAMPKIYFADQEIVTGTIEITFGQAKSSYDFVKGVKVLDSFNEPLTFEKSSGSDVFANAVGEYNVRYSATDVVGNTLIKDVTFVVTAGNSPIVSGGAYPFDINGCKIPCDLKGETEGLLFDDDELVNPDCYGFDGENLILTPEYSLSNVGSHNYKLETDEGVAEFRVWIVDGGYPIFDIENLKNATYIYGAAYSSLPTDKRQEQTGYDYNYILKNSDEELCKATEENGKLVFRTAGDERVPAGSYSLSVTATAANGKISQKEYDFTVKYPSLSCGETSNITKVDETIDGVKADYYFEKADDSDAWSGRISINAPAGAYTFITMDVYVDYCQSKVDGKDVVFRAFVEQDYNRIIKCVDKKTGDIISVNDMLVGRWYSITVYAMSYENGTVYLYFAPFDDNNVGVKAYISNFRVSLDGDLKDVPIFKSTINKAVIAECQNDGTLITQVNYNAGGSVHTTPFSDNVWAEYLAAQSEGGKVLQIDVKFTGAATYNGHINNASTYISHVIRNDRTYIRFYDQNGTEVAYSNLATDTWYKMVFDIDAIKTLYGEMSTVSIAEHIGSSLRLGANTEGETIYVKNAEFADNQVAFKSTVAGAVNRYMENDGTLITQVNYNGGGSVHTTPFSDSVWEKYLSAQEEGGKVMRFDIKFTGSATYNGHINDATTYMSTTIRGNRNYVRFYDQNGTEVLYSNLSVDIWYKMVFNIDAIKAQFGDMSTVTIAGHSGSSLRLGANIEGETVSVKNVEFENKTDW